MNADLRELFEKNQASPEQLERYEKSLLEIEDGIQASVAELLAKDVNYIIEFMKILDNKWQALSENDSKMLADVIETEKAFIAKIDSVA